MIRVGDALLPCTLLLLECQVDVDVNMSFPGQKPKDHFPIMEIVNIFEPEGESNVRSSFRVAEGVGLIGTEETGDIFKTTDRGMSWTKVFDRGETSNLAIISEDTIGGGGGNHAVHARAFTLKVTP
ncbi:MAG: hypothetical protein AB3N33_08600 [Puniceicoccaceae bacterium]